MRQWVKTSSNISFVRKNVYQTDGTKCQLSLFFKIDNVAYFKIIPSDLQRVKPGTENLTYFALRCLRGVGKCSSLFFTGTILFRESTEGPKHAY